MHADYWLVGESIEILLVKSWRPWSRKTLLLKEFPSILCILVKHFLGFFKFYFKVSYLPKRFAFGHALKHLVLTEPVTWLPSCTQPQELDVHLSKQLWDGITLGLAHALPMQLVELLTKCHESCHFLITIEGLLWPPPFSVKPSFSSGHRTYGKVLVYFLGYMGCAS